MWQRTDARLHRRGPARGLRTVTTELHRLRDWLRERRVKSVAMEATGVYWLPLYGVLEATGFEVVMVNGKHTRNLPGRKTDMKDCQWGATLHATACCARASCRRPTSAACKTTCGCAATT